jgi:trk system potassium uptake protein
MIRRIIPFLNIFSAVACFVIGIVLTLELGFVVSTQNRELFIVIHRYLVFYFIVDLVIRLLVSQHRRQMLFSRITDVVLLIPVLGMFFPTIPLLANYLVLQGVLLTILVGRLSHVNRLFKFLHFNPAQIFMLGFVMAIFVGALLLSLPISHSQMVGMNFLDAVFTATSAVCVTGLVSVDVGQYFSGFGQLVILLLIQLGGLGIMTFYALLTLMLHRKMSQTETQEIQANLLSEGAKETYSIIRRIVSFTLVLELIGTALLFFSWSSRFSSPGKALYYSLFHSISAFCNAGFSLFSDSLTQFSGNYLTILTISVLIILGGIGFPVLVNLYHHDFGKHGFTRLKVQTKLPILVTFCLIVFGMLVIFLGEYQSGLSGLALGDKLLMSFFHSVSARTAGFNAVNINAFHTGTIWMLMLLMFVGASPGSTGGGIKTTTFGILMVALWETLNGRERVELFGRTISTANVLRSISIIVISALVFFYVLLWSESLGFRSTFFETISAFGTVGLSLGITANLTVTGKITIIVLMFLGRVGPLTVAFGLSRRKPKPNYRFPEEQVLLG